MLTHFVGGVEWDGPITPPSSWVHTLGGQSDRTEFLGRSLNGVYREWLMAVSPRTALAARTAAPGDRRAHDRGTYAG